MTQPVQILDCTIRDGGYLNNWNFDKKVVREVYRSLSKAGVDYVEIGYLGSEKYFDRSQYGIWRFSDEDDLKEVVDGIHGAKIALMADCGKFDLQDIIRRNKKLVDLIRIAAHQDKIKEAAEMSTKIKENGYEVSLNLMGYSNYTEAETKECAALLNDTIVDYIYVADSYGSILPNQVEDFFRPLLNLSGKKIGFHSHNNLQMAFANTLEAIRCGINIVDGSVYGMGRGAGNLPIEVILAYMELSNRDKYNVIAVLNLIDQYFIRFQREMHWGYQLPYMLSGVFKCHPEYARNLVERREYTIEDIWQILEIIRKIEGVGFSKQALEEVLKKGRFSSGQKIVTFKNSKAEPKGQGRVPYEDRHTGRDFLILANGPNLKTYKRQIDEFIMKYDPVILGANYLANMLVPHYHAFNNKRRFIDYVQYIDQKSRLLIGQHIPQEMVKEHTSREYEVIFYIDELDSEFGIKNGVIQTNCRTISVFLAGLAIVMGAKRIFIVGMDGYLSTDEKGKFHFYNEEEASDRKIILEKHQWNLRYLEQIDRYLVEHKKEGIHILTPTSYKRFYKGINNYL
jgi:4-hydroxy 2-oxovalerate aldolase